MIESTTGVLELLEKSRQERDELDALIKGLEKRLGIDSQPMEPESVPRSPRLTVSMESIPVGFFHNLSQADAAEKLLKLNPGRPLTSKEIINAFRKSGMQVNPKNGTTILYTTLARHPKFERLAGKAWGLAEWYPGKKKRSESGNNVSDNDGESY